MSFFPVRKMSDTYLWTEHARTKMRHYRLTESRVKRVIRHPARVEEGILAGAIAAMQPASAFASAGKPAKNYSEIWVMYVVVKSKGKNHKAQVKVITAWRYPGKAPLRDPVPAEVLRGIKHLL